MTDEFAPSEIDAYAPLQGHRRRRDLPDGLSGDLPVQPLLQKYFRFRLTQITSYPSPSHPTEGRIAIVTDAGRDAVDAAASGA
jgi:hypothetical protein